MTFLSLFAGIGGFDLGFERAGHTCIGQVELDKRCQEVLHKHWPEVPKHGDIRTFTTELRPDIVCGGFPCQDLSFAGNRKGLAGERSKLFWEALRICKEVKPRYIVIENVPGLLSSNKGRDMETVVKAMVELGYSVCWRVLDSQYFGVAQRRRRVFIVASLGDGSCAEVLFEPESLFRDNPPSREAGTDSPGTFTVRSGKDGGGKGYLGLSDRAMSLGGQNQWVDGAESIEGIPEVTHTLASHGGGANEPARFGAIIPVIKGAAIGREPENGPQFGEILMDGTTYTLNTREVHAVRTAQTSSNGWGVAKDTSYCLDGANGQAMAIDESAWNQGENAQYTPAIGGELCFTLRNKRPHGVATTSVVRRLTPTEYSRLQGFPDDHNDMHSNSQRYKQLGNAVTVNVAYWIGKRLV